MKFSNDVVSSIEAKFISAHSLQYPVKETWTLIIWGWNFPCISQMPQHFHTVTSETETENFKPSYHTHQQQLQGSEFSVSIWSNTLSNVQSGTNIEKLSGSYCLYLPLCWTVKLQSWKQFSDSKIWSQYEKYQSLCAANDSCHS